MRRQALGEAVDEAYAGREQARLKHAVLEGYLTKWGFKLGSIAKSRPITLWYVDCFAGPWKSKDDAHRDTSVGIGLRVLQTVAKTWAEKGVSVPLKAVFVEKDAEAFAELKAFVEAERGSVDAVCLAGAFEDQVKKLQKLMNPDDPALVFIDPIGWSGASIRTLRPLTTGRYREVLINVMSSFAHRFTGAENAQASIRALLDMAADVPLDRMSEQDLADLYRERLKDVCGYEYAPDVGIPAPVRDRTWYRLVLGTHSDEGLVVLRDVESKMAELSREVRADAKERERVQKTGQLSFLEPPPDDFVSTGLDRDLEQAAELVPQLAGDGRRWEELWPSVLEQLHIRKTDLNKVVNQLRKDGIVEVDGWQPKQRSPKEHQVVRSVRSEKE